MKKIMFFVMSIVAISIASCCGSTESTEVASDSTVVAVDSVEVVDSVAVDSVAK